MASAPLPSPPIPNLAPLSHSKHNSSRQLPKKHLGNSTGDADNGQSRRLAYKSYLNRISVLSKDGRLLEARNLLTEMELARLQIGPEIYAEFLQGCVYERALPLGRQIHGRIIKNGEFFSRNEYVETKLLVFYSKCDALDVSGVLFSGLRVKNVFSWAAIIGLYCRKGLYEDTLRGYCEMLESDLVADNFVIPNVFKACGALMAIEYGRAVHGYALKMGLDGCVFVASSMMDMYGKCGVLDDARKVFDYMSERNVVAWNSMIVGYVQNGMNEEAIDLFYDMRLDGFEITRVTISSLLAASANIGAIKEGKQGHAVSIMEGLELDSVLGSSLINFYAKVGLIEDAELAFKSSIEKDMVTWNLLISGYIQSGQVSKALNICHKMHLDHHLRFDCVTLSSLLSAAANESDINLGKEAHCYCIRNNLDPNVVVVTGIIKMYSSCQRIDLAREIFDSASKRDLVTWNTIIAAYAELGLSGEAIKLFYQMQLESVPPNVVTWNSLILGFLRNGQVGEAKEMFLQMQSYKVEPNLITWTTIISGLAQNGLHHESILNFHYMQQFGIRPNIVSIICVLSACTSMASLMLGRTIHGYAIRHNLLSSVHIVTSLLDMYAKCGNLEGAKTLFETIPSKELAVCNVMISGFAMHGCASEAIELYRRVKEADGIEPDRITFSNVLSACSHAGLLDEAMEIFNDMAVTPSMEHYGCIVDLLCRGGNFEEALTFTLSMPYEPDSYIVASLIAACGGEIEKVEFFFKDLLQRESCGNYVALSNAYAVSGRWNEVSELREAMRGKGLRKEAGCSWVEIDGDVHAFVAGDGGGAHQRMKEINGFGI